MSANRFNVSCNNLDEKRQKLAQDIKGTAAILSSFILQNSNRSSDIAIMHLETAIMWAVNSVFIGDSNNES